MIHSTYSRRDFLRQVLCWAASSSLIGCDFSAQKTPADISTTGELPLDWLKQNATNIESASRLGHIYLAANTEENNIDQLLHKVNAVLQANIKLHTESPHILENISSAIKSDYMRGDTAFIDSWIVSRTEARLYALVALSSF